MRQYRSLRKPRLQQWKQHRLFIEMIVDNPVKSGTLQPLQHTTVKVLLFVGYRFSWISWLIKKTRNIIHDEMQNVHIIILNQVWNHELKSPRRKELSLNHENCHPRMKVLSQYSLYPYHITHTVAVICRCASFSL